MYFWTRMWLCTIGTAVVIHVLWVSFALPRSWMESARDQLPAAALVAMNRAWCWGAPVALAAATLLIARAPGKRPLWRLRGYAIVAAASIAATCFTIWATTDWIGANRVV
jgi:hypothetical protein